MADQPWQWAVPESSETIKKSIVRQDGNERVSGQAVYTRDVAFPGMLHAKILTSPYAHAKIVSMDIRDAQAIVGVRDILRFDDPAIAKDGGAGTDTGGAYSILTLPATADFFQHPMGVAVVADSEEICDRALRALKIQWEERPFVLDFEESAKPDAPKIMAEARRMGFGFGAQSPAAGNVIVNEEREIGDIKKGFAEADKVIEFTIRRAMPSPAGVEAMACVAQWRGDFLDLWVHHQANPQSNLSAQPMGMFPGGFGMGNAAPPFTHWNKITIRFPYQGSWFGGLSWLAYSNLFVRLAVVLAKRAAGKPVKLCYDESNFYCGGDEAGVYTCKVGAKKDGTITAYQCHMAGARNPAVDKTYECSRIPNIRGTQTWAFTNRGHQACFRHGAAACTPHHFLFDRVAGELGLDPTEVALKNDGCQGHDWDFITRYQKENGFPQRHSLKEVVEMGKKAIDWDRKRHLPGKRKLDNGRFHGMGFTWVNEWHWGAGMMSFPSFACLMFCEGKVTIIGLRCDMGIDTESGYRQCVASELGMKYEDVLIQEQHADNSAYSLAQPAGSGGMVNAATQLVTAARELKQKLLERAASPMPGFMMPGMGGPPSQASRKPEDFDIRESMVIEKSNPERKRPLSQIGGGFGMFGSSSIIVHPEASSPMGMFSFGPGRGRGQEQYVMSRQAHFIEVEVDVETGMVPVTNIVCVNDVGHIFNRKGCEGQQYGGAIMGIGKSSTEEKIYCPRTGVGLNLDHINYHIGTMNDYPEVRCLLNESHLGYGPYGSNGIGENIGASMVAITSSAIYNAVGAWILDFPITPDRVLRALGKI